MTKVPMEYLQANGRYRKGMAITESRWPNFLVNHEDKQAHSLMDSPVFYTDKVRRFYSWQELIEADPPEPLHYPDKPLCVCEDGNIWPISNNYTPDIQDRQMQFKDFHQDAEQAAVAGATRMAELGGDNRTWNIVSMVVFMGVAVVLVLIALQSGMLPQFWKGAPMAMLPGTSLLGVFRRKNAENDSPKPERRPHYRQWETVRLYDEVAGFPWSASLPLELLKVNLPTDCRYTQEIGTARIKGAALFGGALASVGSMYAIGFHAPISLVIAIPLLLGAPMALVGWLKGYSFFMKAPVWIVRRLYAQREIEPNRFVVDYDSLPVIVPEPHTKLTGLPVEIAMSDRRAEAEEVARLNAGSKNGATGTLTRLNLAVAYTPRIFRAYMLYEFLLGRDVKAKMKGPQPKGDRMKQITRSGMAFGALAILALLIFLHN